VSDDEVRRFLACSPAAVFNFGYTNEFSAIALTRSKGYATSVYVLAAFA